MSIKYPLETPICPYCEGMQYDYDGSVNLKRAEYGQDVLHFCEYEDTCGEAFFIKKVEAEPLYKSYTTEEREENERD